MKNQTVQKFVSGPVLSISYKDINSVLCYVICCIFGRLQHLTTFCYIPLTFGS